MNVISLERAVAQATSETLCEIHRRGFGPADLYDFAFDPEPDDLPPQLVDWDELEARRLVPAP